MIIIESTSWAKWARFALDEKKAIDVVTLDVRKVSGVTDYFVVATANSTPHLKALANEVQMELKKRGVQCYRTSGTAESQWIVLDFVDLVVHLFGTETREYYALEQLWSDAPTLDDA